MKKILPIVMVIVLVCICISCRSLRKADYYHVTNLDRGMVPYQKGDTVRFFNERGESVTLVAATETSWWDHFDEFIYEEYRKIKLVSDSGNYALSLTLQGYNYGAEHRYLTFGFSPPISVTQVLYDFDGNFITWDPFCTAYDSVLIGDHVYYNVAKGVLNAENGTSQSYYNKTHGVLQMISDGKNVFTLDTVIFAGER